MNRRSVLRWISLGMLAMTIVFLALALNHPEWGGVIMLGPIRIGATVWQIFYVLYVAVMIGLFAGSFFCRHKK